MTPVEGEDYWYFCIELNIVSNGSTTYCNTGLHLPLKNMTIVFHFSPETWKVDILRSLFLIAHKVGKRRE